MGSGGRATVYAAPVAQGSPDVRRARCNCVIDCGAMLMVVRLWGYVCVECVGAWPPSYCSAQAVVADDDCDASADDDDDDVSVPVVSAAAAFVASCAAANIARTSPVASVAVGGTVAAVVAVAPATY